MRRAAHLLAWLSALALLAPVGARAQYESRDYLPLGRAELRRIFPVRYLGTLGTQRPGYFEASADTPLPERIAVGLSGARVRADEDELLITGKDREGRDWSVRLGGAVLFYACRFYSSDLDANGIRDALLLFPTGGNGLAPTSHLVALTFERDGRPVIFEAEGYFEESNGRILDLLDVDGNGRAELLYMNFDDGYWITNLYEARDARWRRIAGRHGRRAYPLFTRFTTRSNHAAVRPARGRHPFAPDLSNAAPVARGRLLSYAWANVSQSEDISLRIRAEHGREVTAQPVSWYDSFSVVLDGAQGRQIVALSAKEEAFRALLDEIVRRGYAVSLYGRRRPDQASPELLWAEARP